MGENEKTVEEAMLDAVKLALAVTVNDYDSEITDLIDAALLDLKSNGIDTDSLAESAATIDKLLLQAVKTYARAHFRSPADYDRLDSAYKEQKGHMMLAKGYGYKPEEPEDGEGGEG